MQKLYSRMEWLTKKVKLINPNLGVRSLKIFG